MLTSVNENNWLTDPAASRRRTRETNERLLAYSRCVLGAIKSDLKLGVRIDPAIVRDLERAIKRIEHSRHT